MGYIENPFKEGQRVVCINDYFKMEITTGDKCRIGSMAQVHPKKNESLIIDEILGEFLRFSLYDCDDPLHPDYGCRWWKHTHFLPVDEINSYFGETSDYHKEIDFLTND